MPNLNTEKLWTSRTISAASVNATLVRAGIVQLHGIWCNNANAAIRFLKLYDKATAPTVGTDVPAATFTIPLGNLEPLNISWPNGMRFDLGLGFGLTTAVADADTGAVSANEHVVHLFYRF